MKRKQAAPYRCLGVFGRMFGHHFVDRWGDRERPGNTCFRCGMPKGGWPRREES